MIENKILKLLQKTITTLMCFWMLTTQMPINVVFADEINTEENIVEDINNNVDNVEEDQTTIEEDVETINKEDDEIVNNEIIDEENIDVDDEEETEETVEEEITLEISQELADILDLISYLPSEKDITTIDSVDVITSYKKMINDIKVQASESLKDDELVFYTENYIDTNYFTDLTKQLNARMAELRNKPATGAAITDPKFYDNYYLLDYIYNSSNSNKTDVLIEFDNNPNTKTDGIYYKNLKLQYKFYVADGTSKYYLINDMDYSSGRSEGGRRWGLIYNDSDDRLWYDCATDDEDFSFYMSSVSPAQTYEIETGNNNGSNKAYIKDLNSGKTATSSQVTCNWKLWGINIHPTGTWPTRFYYLKIYDTSTSTSTPQHYYVPVIRKSDFHTGIYDIQKGTFTETHAGGSGAAYNGTYKKAQYGSIVTYSLTVTKGTGISSIKIGDFTNPISVSTEAGRPITVVPTCSTGYHCDPVTYYMDSNKSVTINATANTYSVKYNGNGSTSGSMSNSSHTYGTAKNLTANAYSRSYTVTYNANGGTCNTFSDTANYTFAGWATSSTGSVAYSNKQSVSNLTTTNGGTVNLYAKWNSASVTLPTPETRPGYTFDGWYTAETGGTKVGAAGASYTPTEATTLYAHWKAVSTWVFFKKNTTDDSVSGVPSTSVSVCGGQPMPKLDSIPTRVGYSFDGYWDATSGGTQYYNADGTSARNWDKSVTSSTNLYAHWAAKSSTISLDGNGATSTGHTTSTTATYGSAMPYITLPTRTGYKLLGYFDAQEGGTKYYNSDNSNQSARNWDKEDASVTLYAQWEPNTYIITLNRDGATSGSTSVTATYNSELPKIQTLPSKVGYTFDGYYTKQNGDGVKYYNADGTSSRIWTGTSNLTLYAKWILSSYKITFNKNGGNGGTDEIGITYNETMQPISVPTKDGYTFDGYYDEKETQYYYTDGSPAVAKWNKGQSATLYAHWTKSVYTITYTLNGGTVAIANPSSYSVDTETFTLNNPTKIGYIFTGWTGTGLSSASTSVSITKGSTGNRSYTATWIANTNTAYRVEHYQQNTDASTYPSIPTETENKTGTSGANVTPEVKSYIGFTSPSAKTVTIAGDGSTVVKYYYARNKYKVTLDFNGGNSSQKELTAIYGAPIRVDIKPDRTGYYFNGYYDAKDGGIEYINSDTTSAHVWDKTSDATLYAHWRASQSTIYFDNQGGIGTTPSITATYDVNLESISSNNLPTKEGYIFEGYFDAISDGKQYYSSTGASLEAWDKIGTQATLYAHWSAKTSTITFDKQYGTGGTDSTTVTYGSSMPSITLPTRSGYYFGGYYTSTNGSGIQYYSTNGSSTKDWDKIINTTLYAYWKEIIQIPTPNYDLYYNATMQVGVWPSPYYKVENGGALNAGTYTAIVTPNNGYVWPDGTADPINISYTINKKDIVGSTIELSEYEDYAGNPVEPKVISVITIPEKIRLSSSDYTVSYLDNTMSDGNNSTKFAKVIITANENSNFTGTAQKQFTINKKKCKVSFVTNGGTDLEDLEVYYGTVLSPSSFTKPTKDGYDFYWWYTDESLKTELDSIYVIKDDMILYAKYGLVNYRINYDLNGGFVSTANPSSYNIETTTFTLNNPTKEGYLFTGWTGTNLSTLTTDVEILSGSTGNREYIAYYDKKINVPLAKENLICDDTEQFGVEEGEGYTLTGHKATNAGTYTAIATLDTGYVWSDGTYGNKEIEFTIKDNRFEVSFNVLGSGTTGLPEGSIVESIEPKTVRLGETYGSMVKPTYVGYTFVGWFLDNVEITEESIVELTDNVTLVAHWNKIDALVKIASENRLSNAIEHDGTYSYFDTLINAINSASENDELIIVKDFKNSFDSTRVNKSLTINIDNYTFNYYNINIDSGKTLTLTGNGGTLGGKVASSNSNTNIIIDGDLTVSAIIDTSGSVQLINGTVSGELTVRASGSVNMKGGIFLTTNPYVNGETTITGGSFSESSKSFATWNNGMDKNKYKLVYNEETNLYDVIELEDVVSIGDIKYKTLATALQAAQDGDALVLLSDIGDIEEWGSFDFNKKISLDLNNHSITYNSGSRININNDVTINGEGTINCWVNVNDGTVKINDAILTKDVYIGEDSKEVVLYLNNVQNSDNSGCFFVNGKAEINVVDGKIRNLYARTNDLSKVKFNLSGNVYFEQIDFNNIPKENITITGGSYPYDVTQWLRDCYIATNTGHNSRHIVSEYVEASINTTKYKSFLEAYNAAQDGDTIKIERDIDFARQLEDPSFVNPIRKRLALNKAITIDTNGHRMSYDQANSYYRVIRILKDIKFTGNGFVDANFQIDEGGTLTITGGTFEKTIAKHGGDLVLINGIFYRNGAVDPDDVYQAYEPTIEYKTIEEYKQVMSECVAKDVSHIRQVADSGEGYLIVEPHHFVNHYCDTVIDENGTICGAIDKEQIVAVILNSDGSLASQCFGFKEAVDAATDGQTVKLVKDYDETQDITINKNITIDLNGYTLGHLQVAGNINKEIYINSNVKFDGEGNIYLGVNVNNAGTLEVPSGNNKLYFWNLVGTSDNGKLNVNSGNYYGGEGIRVYSNVTINYVDDANVGVHGGSLTINNGHFGSINTYDNKTATIKGGTFVNIIANSGTINIQGGSFSNIISGNVKIYGGKFVNEPNSSYIVNDYIVTEINETEFFNNKDNNLRYEVVKGYEVTLNDQDATISGTTKVVVAYNGTMPNITVPEKAGYVFGGYYDDLTNGTKYYNSDGTSAHVWDKESDATLYAKWLEKIDIPTAISSLTYNGLEQTGVAEGIGYKLTHNTATNADTYIATAKLDDGYIWFDNTIEDKNIKFTISPLSISNAVITLDEYDKYYCGTPIEPSVVSVKVGDITLASDDYKVTYSNNKLTDATDDYSYNEKDAIAKVTAKDNSNFAGSNEVTYRIKRKEYSVTWNLNGGHIESGALPTIKYHGISITIAYLPKKEGYDFVKYVDQDGTKYEEGNGILANKNLVLDAIYEVDPYSNYWVAKVNNVIEETQGVKGKDNNYYFTSLVTALNNAAENSTITLLRRSNETREYKLNESIRYVPIGATIDLNGNTLSGYEFGSNVTSFTTETDNARIFDKVNNPFTIKNGTLKNNAYYGYSIFNACVNVTAIDVDFRTLYHPNTKDAAQVASAWDYSETEKAKLTIKGGSVEGNYVLAWDKKQDIVVDNNSTTDKFKYSSNNYVRSGVSPTITINGGLYVKDPSTYVTNTERVVIAASEENYNFEVVEGGKITFTLNGGTLPSGYSNPTIYTKESGISLPIPTKSEYVFDGWYTDSDLTTLVTNTTSFGQEEIGPKTLYAKWITVIEAAVAKIESNDRLTNAVGFENGYSYYDTLTNAIKDATSTETKITLLKNVAEHDLTISANKNVTLDLNGKTIDANYEGRLFINKGTLTINDSSSEHAGKLINGRFNGTIVNNNDSAGNGIRNKGTLNINGGTISGCTNTTINGAGRGGAIFTTGSGSVVNFAGGSITNSNALYGGAIYVTEESSLLMSGTASISGCNNTASDWGGGAIHIYKASATINGGTISNCTSANRAGAIYVHTSTLTINNVLIDNCTATNGGQAIEVDCTDGNSTIAITGGTIKCNDSTKELIVIGETKNDHTITNNITGGWYSRDIIPSINYGIYKSDDEEHKEAPYTVTSNYYTIKYNSNGGSNIESEKIYSLPGHSVKTIIMNEVPTKDYETFTGWNTMVDGTGTRYVAGDVITLTGDITLYAQWQEQKVKVELHSKALISGNSISSVGQLSGGGNNIVKGKMHLITAESNDTYQFDHWDINGVIKEDANLNYVFTEDTVVYAIYRYEPSKGIHVNIEAEKPFTVKTLEKKSWLVWDYYEDGIYVAENKNGKYDVNIKVVAGSQVELIYDNTNKDFSGWVSRYGSIVSKNPEFIMREIYVETDLRLETNAKVKKYYAEFIGYGNQIIKADNFESIEELKTLANTTMAAPSSGYTFIGWMIDETLLNDITSIDDLSFENDGTTVKLLPKYEKIESKKTITISSYIDGEKYKDDIITEYDEGSNIVISAPEVNDQTVQFICWSADKDGNDVLSTNEKYPIKVINNIHIYAIYSEEKQQEQIPTVIANGVSTTGSDSSTSLVFNISRNVPEESTKYRIVESGILYSMSSSWKNKTDSQVEDSLRFSSVNPTTGNVTLKSGAKRSAETDTASSGSQTLYVNVTGHTGDFVYLRGYMIVSCSDREEPMIIYTNVYKVSYNTASNPTIIKTRVDSNTN